MQTDAATARQCSFQKNLGSPPRSCVMRGMCQAGGRAFCCCHACGVASRVLLQDSTILQVPEYPNLSELDPDCRYSLGRRKVALQSGPGNCPAI